MTMNYPLITTRLKCDRALPACGSCVNRGEISTCDYASRKPDRVGRSQESKEPPNSAQDRIDHLEQLVLGLIQANRTTTQPQVATPVSNDDVHTAERANLIGFQGNSSTISGDIDIGYPGSPGFEASSGPVNVKAGHSQRVSIDTAHWDILLNDVRQASNLSIQLMGISDSRSPCLSAQPKEAVRSTKRTNPSPSCEATRGPRTVSTPWPCKEREQSRDTFSSALEIRLRQAR